MIVLLLLACGVPSSHPDDRPDAVFPHESGFEHGAAWRASSATCQGCHDPLGDAPSAGPACTSCHEAYPHLPGMSYGAVHGAAAVADPGACVGCHAASEGVPTCTSCHAAYPHPQAFEHGAAVRARGGADACGSCHDGGSAPTCATCHEAYPHPKGWAAPAAHGAVTCAEGCHDPAPQGTPACASCHDAYPHPATWVAFDHLGVVQARGEAGCQGCHPAGTLAGPRVPHRCSTACHGVSP